MNKYFFFKVCTEIQIKNIVPSTTLSCWEKQVVSEHAHKTICIYLNITKICRYHVTKSQYLNTITCCISYFNIKLKNNYMDNDTKM